MRHRNRGHFGHELRPDRQTGDDTKPRSNALTGRRLVGSEHWLISRAHRRKQGPGRGMWIPPCAYEELLGGAAGRPLVPTRPRAISTSLVHRPPLAKLTIGSAASERPVASPRVIVGVAT